MFTQPGLLMKESLSRSCIRLDVETSMRYSDAQINICEYVLRLKGNYLFPRWRRLQEEGYSWIA